MRTFTEDDLAALKAKHRIDRVLILDLPELGIALPLAPFTPGSFARWVDEDIKDHSAANDAALTRHVLFYSPAELGTIKRRLVMLARDVVDGLSADVGVPLEAPARKQIDDFNDSTPPGVLAQAGLDDAKVAELLGELGDTKAKIVSVIGQEGELLFSCVLRAPGEAERMVMERAFAAHKGYADACRSAADGCIVWSSMSLADCWTRYPAIPVLILAPVITDLGGSGAARRFRRG